MDMQSDTYLYGRTLCELHWGFMFYHKICETFAHLLTESMTQCFTVPNSASSVGPIHRMASHNNCQNDGKGSIELSMHATRAIFAHHWRELAKSCDSCDSCKTYVENRVKADLMSSFVCVEDWMPLTISSFWSRDKTFCWNVTQRLREFSSHVEPQGGPAVDQEHCDTLWNAVISDATSF